MIVDCSLLRTFIREHTSEYIELQKILTSHKALAPENGGDGELDKCEALQSFLLNHGIKNLSRYDAPDSRAKGGIRPNLVATIEGESDEFTVWVIAHLDVVPAGDLSLWNTT